MVKRLKHLGAVDSTIRSLLQESAQVKQAVADNCSSEIKDLVGLVTEAYRNGRKVILFGNGGSAADAQHIASELVGRFLVERRGLPAMSLTSNTSVLTAVANDFGYEYVFSRQVEAFVNAGDVVIGLSTSGTSPNVAKALRAAKKAGAKAVGFTGRSAGCLAQISDIVVAVPSESTPRIQEAHITIGHIVCELVDDELSGSIEA